MRFVSRIYLGGIDIMVKDSHLTNDNIGHLATETNNNTNFKLIFICKASYFNLVKNTTVECNGVAIKVHSLSFNFNVVYIFVY